jgi:hypothetical protein
MFSFYPPIVIRLSIAQIYSPVKTTDIKTTAIKIHIDSRPFLWYIIEAPFLGAVFYPPRCLQAKGREF